MKSVLAHISTIIFDLGGVILDLEPQKSLALFARYAGLPEAAVMEAFIKASWPEAFEKGELDSAAFRDRVRHSLQANLTDARIDEAWNAILGDLPLARLALVAGLRPTYRTMVLSNTNAIHVAAFHTKVQEVTGGHGVHHYFDKVYYSHEVGMRKPDKEIYEWVIRTNNLQPASTLFIDDLAENIVSARAVGLRTVHLTNQNDLFDLFS